MIHVSLLAVTTSLDTFSLIKNASWVVQIVIAVLGMMSLMSWYIIGSKWMSLNKSNAETNSFLEVFWGEKNIEEIYNRAQSYKHSPVASLFKEGYAELGKLTKDKDKSEDKESDLGQIARSLRRAETIQRTALDSKLPFLATAGSSAPFIGLFGTVWGIMVAFKEIGAQKSASLNVVAPHIAEALIATAIGLVAAIPAVMAYNYFVRRIKVLAAGMDSFQQDFLNIIRRHFLG